MLGGNYTKICVCIVDAVYCLCWQSLFSLHNYSWFPHCRASLLFSLPCLHSFLSNEDMTLDQRARLRTVRTLCHPADPNSLKFSRIIAARPHSWTDQVWLSPGWRYLYFTQHNLHPAFLNFVTLRRDLPGLDSQEEVVKIDSVMVRSVRNIDNNTGTVSGERDGAMKYWYWPGVLGGRGG